jgi:hypothetical protein
MVTSKSLFRTRLGSLLDDLSWESLILVGWLISGDDSGLVKSIRVDGWWVVNILWSVFLDELLLIEEESEPRVITSGQVLGKNVFEVLERHALVGVSIISNHEVISVLWVGWVMLIERSIQVSDHLRSFFGVHVTGSIVIILSENHSGELLGREVIKSSFAGGGSESHFSGVSNLNILILVIGGIERSGDWLSNGSGVGWLILHCIYFYIFIGRQDLFH